LVALEAATLAQRDFDAVNSIQKRTEPLVAALAELGAGAADDRARARVASLLSRRQHSIDFLESQLATARNELNSVQESTQRVARIAPVYGRAEGTPPPNNQLNASG
jgi:hypothetical protein